MTTRRGGDGLPPPPVRVGSPARQTASRAPDASTGGSGRRAGQRPRAVLTASADFISTTRNPNPDRPRLAFDGNVYTFTGNETMAFCAYHDFASALLKIVDAILRWSGGVRLSELSCQGAPAAGPSGRLLLIWEYEAELSAANTLLRDTACTTRMPTWGR
jgi:hypothetical protein